MIKASHHVISKQSQQMTLSSHTVENEKPNVPRFVIATFRRSMQHPPYF